MDKFYEFIVEDTLIVHEKDIRICTVSRVCVMSYQEMSRRDSLLDAREIT